MQQDVAAVPVGLSLYKSFSQCKTAQEFCLYISDAEERGRLGAVKFSQVLKVRDAKTAKIFSDIALEEVAHIALAAKYYPLRF